MRAEFRDDGLLRVPRAIDVDAVGALRTELWREIEARFGIVRDQPDSWFSNPNKPAGDGRGRRLSGMNPVMNSLKSSGALTTVEAPLQRTVEEALGHGRWVAKPNWYSLVSFPGDNSTWNVPHKSWHADEPAAAGHSQPWTVFAFVFLAPLSAKGGGTVVVSGSHRCGERLARQLGSVDRDLVGAFAEDNDGLVNPDELRVLPPAELAQLLARQSAWFNELLSEGAPSERAVRFMDEGGDFDGIPVKVVEITGDPGDVVFLDPRCLHSVSTNIGSAPREVLRLDFRRVG